MDGAWITMPADFYKTERPHRFYLTDFARAQLPFPTARRPALSIRPAARIPAQTGAGEGDQVRRLDPADLRHAFATGLVKMGEHSDIVELCIGHVQQGIRATYQHYGFEKEKRRAFSSAGRARGCSGVVSLVS